MKRSLLLIAISAAAIVVGMILLRNRDATNPEAMITAQEEHAKRNHIRPQRGEGASIAASSSNPVAVNYLMTNGRIAIDPGISGSQTENQVNQILREISSGNSSRAYDLFFLLERCTNASKTLEYLNSRTEDRLRSRQADSEETLKQCSSLPADLIAKRGTYLDLAASRGDLRAQATFGNFVPPDLADERAVSRHPEVFAAWRDKVINYEQIAAQRGSSSAMAYLSDLYNDGTMLDKDPVKSYGYFLAYKSVDLTADQNGQIEQTRGARLTPEQRSQAMAFASQIKGSCCK